VSHTDHQSGDKKNVFIFFVTNVLKFINNVANTTKFELSELGFSKKKKDSLELF